jgi:hypothetical protein
MVGQQVAEAARLKAMLSEVQNLKTAIGQFEILYKGLPGDIANAERYWPETQNGNADGEIAPETDDEAFGAIQQLALAGFIDGSYDGVWSGAFTSAGNVVESKLGRGAMIYVRCCGDEGESNLEFMNHVNVFSAAAGGSTRAGVFTPEEAMQIDSKIDDGIPDSGLVGANGAFSAGEYRKSGCYTGVGSGAVYDVAAIEATCQMYFGYNWE